MFIKRRLTRFEKIGLIFLAPVIIIILAILIWSALFFVIDKRNDKQVATIANQLSAPPNCQKGEINQYRESEVFGVSYHADVTFTCQNTTVAQVTEYIKTNLATIRYDIPGYTEMFSKNDYPDVNARFNYSNKNEGDGALQIVFQLQDKKGETLTAPNHETLVQIPVDKIKVGISL